MLQHEMMFFFSCGLITNEYHTTLYAISQLHSNGDNVEIVAHAPFSFFPFSISSYVCPPPLFSSSFFHIKISRRIHLMRCILELVYVWLVHNTVIISKRMYSCVCLFVCKITRSICKKNVKWVISRSLLSSYKNSKCPMKNGFSSITIAVYRFCLGKFTLTISYFELKCFASNTCTLRWHTQIGHKYTRIASTYLRINNIIMLWFTVCVNSCTVNVIYHCVYIYIYTMNNANNAKNFSIFYILLSENEDIFNANLHRILRAKNETQTHTRKLRIFGNILRFTIVIFSQIEMNATSHK